jgi:hypothetical protein
MFEQWELENLSDAAVPELLYIYILTADIFKFVYSNKLRNVGIG